MARRVLSAAAVAWALGATLCSPRGARAYEERVTLELGAGYALAPLRGEPLPQGPSIAVESLVGLSPSWSLGFRLGYAALFPQVPTHLASLGVEATYQIDVVSVVPRISFGALGMLGVDGGRGRGDLAPTVRLGLDVLRDGYLFGFDVRGSIPVLGRIEGAGPVVLELGLRLGWVLDRY